MSNFPVPPNIADWDHQPYSNGGYTAVAGNASAHTEGSYVEIENSTLIDADGFFLYQRSYAGNNICAFVDVAVGGAGSEQDIVVDFPLWSENVGIHLYYDIPIPIPSGTRLSARVRASTGSPGNQGVGITLYKTGDKKQPIWAAADVSIGKDLTNTKGTSVVNGTSGFGSWTELEASISNDIVGFFVHYGHNLATIADSLGLFEIGIGAASSEQTIWGQAYLREASDGQIPHTIFIPIAIPSGTRVAIRTDEWVGDNLDWCMTGVRA